MVTALGSLVLTKAELLPESHATSQNPPVLGATHFTEEEAKTPRRLPWHQDLKAT